MKRRSRLARLFLAVLLLGSLLATLLSVAAPSRAAAALSRSSATTPATPAPAPRLSVTPAASVPGGHIILSGTGFSPHEALTVSLIGHGRPLATLQANARGALPPTRVMVPYAAPAGQHTLTLTGASSQRSASAGLTLTAVSATLTVAPSTTDHGATVAISGTNWAPGEAITITLSDVAAPLVVARADAAGLLPQTSATIPYTATAGAQTLTATGTVSQRTATAALTINRVDATLAVTPTTTNRGGLVMVSGATFAPSEPITVTIEGRGAPLATLTATAQGTLPATGVSIPYDVPEGAQTLRLTGAISTRAAAAALSVQALTPSLSVSTAAVSPGTTIFVSGKDFGRAEKVTLALNGAALPTSPAVITTTNGAFTATITVPASLLRGANTLSALGNQSHVSAVAALQGSLPAASTFYYAGASTMAGERARLPILNANAQPAHVELTFYYHDGAPGQASLDVPANGHATADLNALAGANRAFGVKLVADRAVRAQLQLDRAGKDGFSLLGVAAPQTTWYLAEGYTGLTFRQTLALLNPGQTPAQVELKLLPLGGRAAKTVTLSVAPQRTHLVDVNSLLPRQSLSVIAQSSQPIVLTRLQTFSTDGYGITAKAGVNSPATSWLFAEGTTTTRFETFLTILNPNPTAATVTVSFYGQTGGSLGSRTLVVPGLARANLKLNDVLHASGIASVVTSNAPIVVERAQYLGSPNSREVAGSVVFGRNGAGLSWSFPGGTTEGRNEYLLLYNPSAQTVEIDATFYGTDGKVVSKTLHVPPTVRYNVDVNRLVPELAPQHGITLRGANGLGFVAEQTVFAPDFSALSSTEGAAE